MPLAIALEAAGGVACRMPTSVIMEFCRMTPVETKGQHHLNHIDSDMKGAGDFVEDDSESEPELPAFETVEASCSRTNPHGFAGPCFPEHPFGVLVQNSPVY